MPTKIPYLDETWNMTAGCSKCSPGCLNCYAEKMAYRLSAMGIPHYDLVQEEGCWNGNIELITEALDKPLHWRKPRTIGVQFMGDLFHPKVPFEFIDKVFAKAAVCGWHKMLMLTKRIARAKGYYERAATRDEISKLVLEYDTGWATINPLVEEGWPIPNIHLGVTICTPDEKPKIEILRQIPTARRWISFEPLLGDVGKLNLEGINWVVVGCESFSGGGAGRFSEEEIINDPRSGVRISPENIWRGWAADIVRQCKIAGIPCFVKQIPINGKISHEPAEFPEDLRLQEYPNARMS